ncbi:hypothetical protein K438DRAFT_1769094 [Mycena galopus ATCC 62051]|nr:hypothetical protein K438DRAFT_1769094 [Mycena galopus ATCC 62051]
MKLFSPSVFASLGGYRLGYSPQLPYPWPWTTLVGLGILLTSTVLLTCVNIPLSAYDVVQEFTYFPNATLTELPMSNLIPSFLRDNTGSFAAQTWSVGDTFHLNNSIFQFTIASALDPIDRMEPVTSFSYSNVPFSENCDVTNVTISVERTIDNQSSVPFQYFSCDASAYITCSLPTRVALTATLPNLNDASSIGATGDILTQVNDYSMDMQVAFYVDVLGGIFELPYGEAGVTVTARPCCNCIGDNSTNFLEKESAELLQQPCSSQPARFVTTWVAFKNSTSSAPWGTSYALPGNDSTDLFDGISNDWLDGYVGYANLSILNDPFQNMFQVYYHLLRRDLGVLLDNQIYNSPDMYNRSINLINPGVGMEGTPFGTIGASAAQRYHTSLANETLMEEWRNSIQVFVDTDRVPVFEYLRPTPRRKSLGSAITSVFSATFAMVATVWGLFSMIAIALVRSRDRALRDAEWEGFKDRSKAGSYELGDVKGSRSSEELSLTTAHEEQDAILAQMADLKKEISSIRGLLQQRGLSESE